MKKGFWLTIGLVLVTMPLAFWNSASADGPDDHPAQDGGRRVGLVSTTAECVRVETGTPNSISAKVRLEWEGRIEDAFLVLTTAGSEGGHSLYVNGQRVGSAPVRPGDQPCQAGALTTVFAPTDEIPIPAEILTKGENIITLTNDADINDGWTALELHLEIHGILTGPPVALLENPALAMTSPPEIAPQTMRTMTVISGSVLLTSSYDGVQQVMRYQIPDNYIGNPTPLLIGLHGYGGNGEGTRASLAPGANERGWLLAVPDMHGRYYTNNGNYAFAWPGAQHDVIDTIVYMRDNYNVDTSRIYVAGGSMGGEAVTVMAAKYPDVFAAAAGWKPITDLANWYYDGWLTLQKRLRQETGEAGCDPDIDTDFITGCGTPPDVPFAYQRRSAISMPQNSRLVPLKMWHDVQDELVVVAHSINLKTAINSWDPPLPVVLDRVDTGNDPNNLCVLVGDTTKHCYNPPPLVNSFPNTITLTVDARPVGDLFDFLGNFTLNLQPPPSLTIRTDESKPFYWLNVAQTGGDHWSEVDASYDLINQTVTALISDTQPLTVAFNLSSTPIAGSAGILRPGLGLPAATYLVKGGGNNQLHNYTTDYLTVTLTTTGQYTLSISAIQLTASAYPTAILADQSTVSTATVTLKDRLGNPAPDGSKIALSTTAGTFLNAGSTVTVTLQGGNGQVSVPLVAAPTAAVAEIVATFEDLTASTTVTMTNAAPTGFNLNGAEVDENSPPGTFVGSLSASDPNPGDILSYDLLDDAGGRFALVGNQVVVTGTAGLNYEAAISHTIQARVRDPYQLFQDQEFVIIVRDVNESPTRLALSNTVLDSSMVNGDVIGILSTADPDQGDNHTYTLVDDAGGRFSVVGNELRVADVSLIDFSARYSLEIRTTDSGGLSLDRRFTVSGFWDVFLPVVSKN